VTLTEERKQLLVGLIAEALDAYESGEVDLARLVADVERGVEALFDVADHDWVEELRSAWSGSEIVYALALDEGRSTLSDDERANIDKTITELRSLISRSSA
jgi:hypothetical protein